MTAPVEKDPRFLGAGWFWLTVSVALVALGLSLAWQWKAHRSGKPGRFEVLHLDAPAELVVNGTERVRVLVHDLETGEPVGSERVVLLGFVDDEPERELGSGVTDVRGEWVADIRTPAERWKTLGLVAYLPQRGELSARSARTWQRRAPSASLTTDKPTYQPGQVVHARLLAFDPEERPDAGKEVTFTLLDPKGTKLFKESRTTSEFGIAHVDFPLASEVVLGDYVLEAAGKAGFARRSISIKRYTLPKGKVEVRLPEKSHLKFETVTGTVSARWSFGHPMVGAEVALHRGAVSPEPFFSGKTNLKGELGFELRAPVSDTPIFAVVELEGGTTLEAKAQLRVARPWIRVDAVAECGTLVPGVDNLVYVVVSDRDEPVQAEVSAGASGTTAKTDEQGVAAVSVRPVPGKETYDVVATTADGRRGTGSVRVASQYEHVRPTLIVRAARPALPAGGRAPIRVFVPGGNPGSVHVALYRRGRLLSSASGALAGDAAELALDVPSSAHGLVLLEAHSFGSRGLFEGRRYFLADGSNELSITASTSQKAYAPGDKASLDLYARAPRGPVKVAFGLAAVDEAFFALAETRPDLEKRLMHLGPELEGFGERYRDARSSRVAPDTPGVLDTGSSDSVRFAALGWLSERARSPRADRPWFDREVLPALAEERAAEALARGIAWLGGLGLLSLAGFLAWGVSRVRRAEPASDQGPIAKADFEGGVLRLMVSWVVGVLSPFVGAALGEVLLAGTKLFAGTGRAAGAGWVFVSLLNAGLAFWVVRQIARSEVARSLPALRKTLWLAPTGMLLCQLALAGAIFTRAEGLKALFPDLRIALIAALPPLAAQLTFGVLALARRVCEPTSRGRRIWLVFSRASLVGLPFTLAFMGFVAYKLKTRTREYFDFVAYEEVSASAADHKEGGTGTRAKGEEGSMGNKRFGVQGPADNAELVQPSRVRSHFPETLAWLPEVVSDESGYTRVILPLADSITTYRVGLSAVSANGEVGSLTFPLTVLQDFFVDLSVPPTLTQGDEILLPVTAFNYLPEPQTVRLSLEAEGFEVRGKRELELGLAAGETRGASFTVRARAAGERSLRVKAAGTKSADAVERKVLVEPDGLPVVRVVNGSLDGPLRTELELPKDAIEGATSLTLKIYGGSFAQLVESLDGALRRPSGCFEQTSSTTYPNVLLLDFLRRTKAASPAVEAKAKAYIDEGYQRLLSFEVPGGGFDWFGRGPANTVLSAYGLVEFHDMSRLRPVDEEMMARTRSFLYSAQRSDGSWEAPSHSVGSAGAIGKDDLIATAYIAWALAETGDRDARLVRALDRLEQASSEDAYAQSLIGSALLAGGREAAATKRIRSLVGLARRDGALAHWESSGRGLTHGYGQSLAIETTGLVTHLFARASVEPELRRAALAWLASKRDAHGLWPSTSATIAAMRAMLDDARRLEIGEPSVRVSMHGELLREVRLARGSLDVHHTVSLSDRVRVGQNPIELVAPSGADVSFQLVQTHHLPWSSPLAKAAAPAMFLSVDYGSRRAAPGRTLPVVAEARWNGERPSGMVLVEVGVPPGFEVESDDLERLVKEKKISRWSPRASSVTIYLDAVKRDEPAKLGFRMRALFPVRAVAPPSVAYAYYEPEARYSTRPVLVTVAP